MTIIIPADAVCSRIGLTEFSETVLHRALQRLPEINKAGPWIAGGSVRRTLEGKKLDSDFDLFFASAEQADEYAAKLAALGIRLLRENDKNRTYIVPASIPKELEGAGVLLPEMKVQLVTFQYFETAAHVIDRFDFTLCQFAYDGSSLYMSDLRFGMLPERSWFRTGFLTRHLACGD